MLDALPVHILPIDTLFGSANHNVLPEPLELGVGEWLSLAVCYHIRRDAGCFGFPETICKAAWDRNVSFGSFRLQNGRYRGAVLLAAPCSAHGNIGCIGIQKDTIPLQCQDFLPAHARIQAEHGEYIRGKSLDGIQ